jgi:hypothetical protein
MKDNYKETTAIRQINNKILDVQSTKVNIKFIKQILNYIFDITEGKVITFIDLSQRKTEPYKLLKSFIQ